ncbi:MAG: GGDEF and EAL domain-containing protein [Selenomonadaceae bacterium]|nr:GGDEF and EAL domain-containing protein [Selenomonadaceae bacterium]MDY2685126.1 GGDEF and EAL domain-containing protein [Selenomonadaceae bacterium]
MKRKRSNRIPLSPILKRVKLYFDLLKRSTDAYLYVEDIPSKIAMLSPNLVQDFDLPNEVMENLHERWAQLIHPEERVAYETSFRESVEKENVFDWSDEYRVKTRKGEYIWVRARGRVGMDEQGKPQLFVGVMTRMARRNQADEVTGLLNKYQFERGVKAALANWRATQEGGAILLFGLDNFKIVNETNNRSFGDQALKHVARAVEKILPEGMTLYKLDGDEYATIYPGAGKQEIAELFASLQSTLSHPHTIDGRPFFCTASAGTAFYPAAGKDYLVLHKHAEAAMDFAKQEGKNRNCLFTKEQYNRWVRSISIRDAMFSSVENGCEGFSLFYQPQVDARTQKLIGAEALLRWKNPKGRMVAPMEFIPVLEETKLIILVGKWIFEEAVKTCKKWRKIQPNFRMSINLSYEQVRDLSFQDFVLTCLEAYHMPPDSVTLELTESKIVADWSFVNKQFDQFRQSGVHIAMDDFGTGYSSLSSLKNLSCDIVKIDREFVKEILANEFDRELVKYTVALCHSIGICCCIEGVEDDDVFRLLRDTCMADSIQGYLFGHPESEENFEKEFFHSGGVMPELPPEERAKW